MTEPSQPRPVPGPPRGSGSAPQALPPVSGGVPGRDQDGARFDDLAQRPVAEHVAAFEAEHARLQRELGTIDRL